MQLFAPVIFDNVPNNAPVQAAVADVRRDCAKVLGEGDGHADAGSRVTLDLNPSYEAMREQTYRVRVEDGGLVVSAPDELGLVYGLYHVSREFLGVPDFWFWADIVPLRRDAIEVPDDYDYRSKPFAVRDRGWFINDEVLFLGWQIDGEPLEPWCMAFETLLRCGGNMVIPGTGLNVDAHVPVALSRGLSIAQHHAEPLGATMFSSAYPDLEPSWDKHADLFEGLWADSIKAHHGQSMIWNVGFRGQGDSPFWCADPSYDTDESRGRLMGDIIRRQRSMLKEDNPKARMCVYLYGETMELYAHGHLDLPDDVIKVWSDNGFGRMVTRRQGNHNPRVPAMPNPDDHGAQGIYYHASFYDLQAASHITALPNQPVRIAGELAQVLRNGGDDYWIINSSNIKPHMYYLDLMAQLWRDGVSGACDDAGLESLVEEHAHRFAATYFGADNADGVAAGYRGYFDAAVAYGPHWDDHAGDQFWNHVARMLVSQFMRDRTSREPDLLWATDAPTLKGQAEWYLALCEQAVESYGGLLEELKRRQLALRGSHARGLFVDTVMLQTRLQLHCAQGARFACLALLKGFDGSWRSAFYFAGCAKRAYAAARGAMDAAEHGVWHGYYGNECLVDVAQSVWVMGYLMSFVRNMGDGPHFYQWQRDFIYSKESRKVLTLMNVENHLTDDELFDAICTRWE